MTTSTELLNRLHWWKLNVELLSTFNHTRSWLTILQGIIKAVTLKTAEQYNLEEFKTNTPVFHLTDKKFNSKIYEGTRLDLEIIFNPLNDKALYLWRQAFIEHLNEDESSRRFLIREVSDLQKRDIKALMKEKDTLPQRGELCLEFMTPLPFTPLEGRDRCYITKEQFIKLITGRLKKLSDLEINYEIKYGDWYLLPYYWNYTEIRHQSLSQPGRVKYINGCTGKLYIKGNLKDLLPYLIIAEEIHIGTKITYGRGYYKLNLDSPIFFTSFPDRKLISTIALEVLNKNDSIEKKEIDLEKLSNEITQNLKDRTYKTKPPTAFHVKEGFLVEKYGLKDLIVQQYLLNLLERPIDMNFTKGVIGYRKCLSLQDGYEMITRALQDGYEQIAIFDLKSYYQGVRHEILKEMLERILPERDYFLIEMVMDILKTGYILSGLYHERKEGIPRSSPLSSILANFYLHPVDEVLESECISIRYADRFLLLAKTLEALQEAIKKAEGLFEKLNLKIDNKTFSIRHYTEGFKFCGLTFDGENLINAAAYKKPLYIVEPDVFIGINGEAIEIRKKKDILSSIPAHRISEIIITSRVNFSTAMLELASKNQIPVTIQLNSGYNVTTIKTDTKKFYELSFLHTQLYAQLDEDDILEIAKLIVSSKIRSYTKLFSKRYEKKDTAISSYLESIEEKLHTVESLRELRAYEGLAAKRTFKELNNFIKKENFHLKVRIRRPADRINSLLNFGYYLLFSRLNTTVRATGLNPYLGFLHDPLNRYESLVADLQELFRARVDNFILKLINLNIFTEEDFIETKRGFRLNYDGIKKFISHFEAELDRKYASEDMSFEETLYDQVQQIKRWILEEGDLFFYLVMP